MGTAIDEYKGLVRRNKPIVYNGLTFNPLKVEQIALYQSAKPSFELMQSSLPPQLAMLSWCECLDALDRQSHEEGKNTIFLATAMIVIAIATGLPQIDGTYPIREVRRNEKALGPPVPTETVDPGIIQKAAGLEIR